LRFGLYPLQNNINFLSGSEVTIMVTKELVKSEIEKLNDDYILVLYKIIKALESLTSNDLSKKSSKKDKSMEWHRFIKETYGCLAGSPIERGNQGEVEMREEIK
jgi:hypothetical protein